MAQFLYLQIQVLVELTDKSQLEWEVITPVLPLQTSPKRAHQQVKRLVSLQTLMQNLAVHGAGQIAVLLVVVLIHIVEEQCAPAALAPEHVSRALQVHAKTLIALSAAQALDAKSLYQTPAMSARAAHSQFYHHTET